MLSIEEAWAIIAGNLYPLPETVVARGAARRRVLARDLVASDDWPAFDMSAMDGYAVDDAALPGRTIRVKRTIAAGEPPGAPLEPGTATRIMTGAPIPTGAERVIPFEVSDRGTAEVVFQEVLAPGANIRRRGEILRRGEVALARGTTLGPSELSLAASLGARNVMIHQAPRVSLVTTGDEIVRPDEVAEPGKIRDSHSDFFAAAVAELGLELATSGIARDAVEDLHRHLGRGLEADVLVVTGGVSAGDFDAVEGVLTQLGCTVLFDAVAMQPGKPLVAARGPRGWVFALPGNPASAMVSWWLFVRPALLALQGVRSAPWSDAVRAVSTTPLPPGRDRDRFLPANAELRQGNWVASVLESRGSHDLLAYGRANALVRVRAGAPPLPTGSACEILHTEPR